MQLQFNVPPFTRLLLALTLVTSAVFQVVRSGLWVAKGHADFIALIPQLSLFYPWVYFTATFAEQNILTLSVTIATILFGGKYLERAWSSFEFGRFVLLVTLLPNLTASLLYVLWFAITRKDDQAWTTLQGSVALQGAFLVAFKQLVPEHTVTILKGMIRVRVKHFPAMFLAAQTLSGFVLGTDTAFVLGWLGFMISWIYLRFYKKQLYLSSTSTGGREIRGDASETFAFAYFWPDIIQPSIAAVSDGVYKVLVGLRICVPFSVEEVESSNEQATARGEGGLPSIVNPGGRRAGGGKREEAERRRALALKALDQRLSAASASKAASQQSPALPGPDPKQILETSEVVAQSAKTTENKTFH